MSRINNLTTALAAALLCAAPSLHAVELQSAGSDTKLSVYGYVWGYANYYIDSVNSGEPAGAGSMFYGDWADQTGRANNQLQFATQPTRFGFASTTPSANLGDVQTKIEYDLNGSNSHLRHAYIKVAGWTFGRSWSLWNDLDAGADTVDWAGAIGAACYDTPRFIQVSYVGNIDKNNSFGISLEQNSGQGDGSTGTKGTTDYKIPSIVGMYQYSDSWGHIGVRVLGQNYGSYLPAKASTDAGYAAPVYDASTGTYYAPKPIVAAPATAKDRYSKMFFAAQLSGDVKIAKDDLIWSVYTGKAVGNYGTGFQAVVFDDTNKDVYGYKNIGWLVGYTHNWTDKVRSNIVLSGVSYSSDDDINRATAVKAAAADAYGPEVKAKAGVTDGTSGKALKTAYYGALNTFVMVTKNLQFGAEYVYEQAKSFGSNNPWSDIDGKGVNKQSNSKIHLAVKATF